jgi:hypothetical protein
MKSGKHILWWFFVWLLFCWSMNAQQTSSLTGSTTVPRLVNFSGKATDIQGKLISGIAGATFAIYKEETGGSPLWLETQNIQADAKGNYSVQLGATKPDGLPLDLFSSGEARWLGVTINSGEEQPRALLVSVPYALKAADAETVGGLPASAFVLANQAQGNAASTKTVSVSSNTAKSAVPAANPAVTGKGVVDFIPMWDTTSDIIDSVMFQKSSQIGINTTAPAATLDVNGKSDVRDTLTLFPKGTDPTLAINGTTFKVDQAGKVSFVSGQTFPGTGTITGVTAGTDLTGGGTSGKVTLNLDTTKVPQLNSVNTFTGNQGVIGTLTATGSMGVGTSSPATRLDVFSTSNPNGPIGQFGSNGGNDSSSLKIYNGSGITETFQSGCIGCFVPGTQVGDAGLRASPGKNSVFGDSGASRLMLDNTGNALQPLYAGGMVKAALVVYIENGGSIGACFNSTLSGAAATTPPCGFSTLQVSVGNWLVYFPFSVSNHVLSATAFGAQVIGACGVCETGQNNEVLIREVDPFFQQYLDVDFNLVVY